MHVILNHILITSGSSILHFTLAITKYEDQILFPEAEGFLLINLLN